MRAAYSEIITFKPTRMRSEIINREGPRSPKENIRIRHFGDVFMASKIIYSDKLVDITRDSILFRNYYFPFGSKTVSFSEIDTVMAKVPTIANGKWRIQGTVDFRTWFPRDWKRPSRDRIFVISFPNQRRRIGFTVEDSNAVEDIFSKRGLL